MTVLKGIHNPSPYKKHPALLPSIQSGSLVKPIPYPTFHIAGQPYACPIP